MPVPHDPEPLKIPPAAGRPRAAALVIGDEILSGRTRDANLPHLATRLTAHGIDLREARVVSDEAGAIEDAVRALARAHDHVFTTGGIGPTHDDITADCVARAIGVALGVREDARAALETHYAPRGIALNAARLRMARVPEGATLIDNPVSAAPGFSIGNVHVMAGVPAIFQAMLEGLLARLKGGAPLVSETLRVARGEGDVAGPLGALARARPELRFGSYPSQDAEGRFSVQVVIRGTDAAAVRAARAALAGMLGVEAQGPANAPPAAATP